MMSIWLWELIISFVPSGDHQQHHNTKHDFHQDLTEVWPVGGQQGQHCLWTGLRFRAAAGQGEREHFCSITWGHRSICRTERLFVSVQKLGLLVDHPVWKWRSQKRRSCLKFRDSRLHSAHLHVYHWSSPIVHCLSYNQFAEKFQEVKEAAKLAKDKSQEKVETLSNHSQVNSVSQLSEFWFSTTPLLSNCPSHTICQPLQREEIKPFTSTYFVSQTLKGTVSVFMASSVQRIELKYLEVWSLCWITYKECQIKIITERSKVI